MDYIIVTFGDGSTFAVVRQQNDLTGNWLHYFRRVVDGKILLNGIEYELDMNRARDEKNIIHQL